MPGTVAVDGAAAGGAGAARDRAQAAEQDAAALQHLAAAEAELPGRLAALDGLRQTAADADQLVGSLEAAQQELPERIAALDEQLAAARLVGAALAGLREQQAAISRQAVGGGPAGRPGAATRRAGRPRCAPQWIRIRPWSTSTSG